MTTTFMSADPDIMAAKGTFSFRTENVFGHKQRFIDDNLSLRILRVDDSIAEMYFADGKGNRIDIPAGLMVTNAITHSTIARQNNTQTFALAWSESYIVTIDNVQIVRFANLRQWSLQSNMKFTNVGADEIEDQAVRYDGTEDELLSAKTER